MRPTLHPHSRRLLAQPPRATPGDDETTPTHPRRTPAPQPRRRPTQAGSTDAVASALTRRFGLAGGLAWLGVLTVGVVGEQVKTRLEVAEAKKSTRSVKDALPITLPDGTSYRDEVVGGGTPIAKGLLVALHSTLAVGEGGTTIIDSTRARDKPIVFIAGRRPLTGGLTQGAEAALLGMCAGGVRVVQVPATSGFGEAGATLRPTEHVPDKRGEVPPGAALTYHLEVLSVSVPPS